MALTLQECIDKIKKEYPDHYPYVYIEIEGKYVFNIIPKGTDPEGAISDMHVVDPENGYVSGSISIMEFLEDAKFREAWKHANLVANHDESLQHSSFPKSSSERGWRVRKNRNGSKSGPFVSKASDYGDNLTYGGSLMHHGIKGQSWGVRNGPPYPLDQKTHNKVVKGNAKVGTGSEKSGMVSPLMVELIADSVALLSLLGIKAWLSSPRQKKKTQDKLSSKNEDLSADLLGDIADVGKHYTADNMPPTIKGKHSIEDDMAAVNPRYKDGVVPGTSNNCVLCSFTYDLRRRGYDVTAMASSSGNITDVLVNSLYENPKTEKISASNFTNVFRKAEQKYPEGSRGQVTVSGPYMGHSVAWEIRNGQMEVYDTQRNKKMNPGEFSKYGFYSSNVKFIRTDNLKVKPEAIHLVSAAYKPGAKKILAEERKQVQGKLSESERRKNYEEAYLKEHPNADRNSEGLKNYVESQMNAK